MPGEPGAWRGSDGRPVVAMGVSLVARRGHLTLDNPGVDSVVGGCK